MLRAGIVGLPNVGKSTLFNALTAQATALAANYPFATIEPNVGVVPVPDERLEPLAKIVKTSTPAPPFPLSARLTTLNPSLMSAATSPPRLPRNSSRSGEPQTTPDSASAAGPIPNNDASTKPTSPNAAKPRHTPAQRRDQIPASRS